MGLAQWSDVAKSPDEVPSLETIAWQASQNGAHDLHPITLTDARAREPRLRAVAALFSPRTGIVDSHALRPLATRRTLTPAQLVFRFALDKGMTPLTGTSNASHMREDLAVLEAPPLGDEELSRIESMG